MSTRKLRVLLAEDDAIGARFAIAAVERLGHEVVSVDTGRAALDLLEREHFDVALLDLGLPELSGLDVARRLRSHERTNHVENALVIIALTASDLDDGARERAGIDAVLEKPVHVVFLGETLERCRRVRASGGPEAASVAVLDLAALSERASHEEDFIRELLGDFLDVSEGTPREIAALVEAGRHRDATGGGPRGDPQVPRRDAAGERALPRGLLEES